MKMELPHLTSITSNVAFRTTDDQCPSEDLSYLNRAVTQPKLQPLGGSIRQSKRNFQGEECESTLEPQRKQLCRAVSRRIPCKARGVSQEHRADIAFFDVPEDAPHGLLLRCSSDECANSPRRFRYCRGKQRRVSLCIWSCAAKNQDSHLLMTSHLNFNTVCAIPVSRRNFVNRHGHGLVHSAKDVKTRVDQNSRNFIFSQTMTCSPCGVSAVQESRNRFASSPHKTCHSDPTLSVLILMKLNILNLLKVSWTKSLETAVGSHVEHVVCRKNTMLQPRTSKFQTMLSMEWHWVVQWKNAEAKVAVRGFAIAKVSYSQQFHRKTRQASYDICWFHSVCERPVARRNFSKRHGHVIHDDSKQHKESSPEFVMAGPPNVVNISHDDAVAEGYGQHQVDFTVVDAFFMDFALTGNGWSSDDRELQASVMKAPTSAIEVAPTRYFSRSSDWHNTTGAECTIGDNAMKMPNLAMKVAPARLSSRSTSWHNITRTEKYTTRDCTGRAPLSGLDITMTEDMMEKATLGIDFSSIFDTAEER